MRKPNKVNQAYTDHLRSRLVRFGISCPFDVYVTDTVRGRCSYKNRNVTVPLWTMTTRESGYDIYYACHELAHVLVPVTKGDMHGPKFMAAFKSICPKEFQHYELEYKPRLATAAGIRSPK